MVTRGLIILFSLLLHVFGNFHNQKFKKEKGEERGSAQAFRWENLDSTCLINSSVALGPRSKLESQEESFLSANALASLSETPF